MATRCNTAGFDISRPSKSDQAGDEGTLGKRMKKCQVAILLVGAAHGVLSGQLAAGWLD